MPSRDLLSQPKKIEKLKQTFPDKYIATPDGEIIYTPHNLQVQSETLESSPPPNDYQWIHRLVTGGNKRDIILGARDIQSVQDSLIIQATRKNDEKPVGR